MAKAITLQEAHEQSLLNKKEQEEKDAVDRLVRLNQGIELINKFIVLQIDKINSGTTGLAEDMDLVCFGLGKELRDMYPEFDLDFRSNGIIYIRLSENQKK